MAQLINLKLSRNDRSSPWGFRLQGGKDFGTPLLIQKVNFGSLAEKAGLQVGDALVRVNGQDVYDVKHKDAQDVILGAGNAFELTIQRGGTSTWKPSVTPVGPSPVPSHLSQSPQLVTKTSLAKVGPQSPAFGSSHNSATRPFSGALSPKIIGNGYGNDSGSVKAIVNKQYNTPVGIYSEENIAETLTAQAEVLAGGVLGVNFKKNEKNYEANKSEVFKMVQEADKEPRDLETDLLQSKFAYFSAASHAIGGRATSPRPVTPTAAAIKMPEQRDPYLGSPLRDVDKYMENVQPLECNECRKDIIGVFVRIKDKNLHVECFKCATCGSSLKNVGYYNINNKLYCDIHAKMVARQNPPAPSLEPVTVPPGCQPPLGSFNIIPNKSKDVHSVQSPQPSTISPLPFHTPPKVSSNAKPYEAPKQTPTPSTYTGGYNQVHTGFNSQMKTNSIYTDESKNSVNSQPRLPFLKPKPSTGSAFCSVTPNSITAGSSMCPTLCAQDVFRTFDQCKQTLSASISTQMLIESSKIERSRSPVQNPCDVGTAEIPHEMRSLLPPNNNVRAISPSRLVVFPPEMPPEYRVYSNNRSKTSTPQPKREIDADAAESRFAISSSVCRAESSTCSKSTVECLEVGEENLTRKSEEDEERRTTDRPAAVEPPAVAAETKRKAATAVTEGNRTESPMVAALKTAPERSYSPLPTFVDASEFVTKPSSDDACEEERPTPTMSEALTIAPDRSYKELSEPNAQTRRVGNNPVRYVHGYNNKKTPVAPLLLTRSLIYSPASLVDSEDEQIASLGLKSFPPVSDALKLSTAAGDFDRAESAFEYVEEPPLVFDEPGTVQEDTAVESSDHEVDVAARSPEPVARHPFTASGLHEPSDIPRYQQSIPENPHRAASGGGSGSSGPKPSIKNASFLKREANVHGKVARALGYEPSSLDGRPSKSGNVRPETPKSSPADTSLLPAVPHVPAVEPVVPMPKTSLPAALLSKKLTCFTKKQQPKCIPTPLPVPDIGGQPTGRTGAGASAGLTVPRRGRGVLNPQNLTPGARVPLCGQCNSYIRGPFITALGKIWCPEHFVCTNEKCRRPLQDIGFVEEDNGLYCEYCFEQYLAPVCHKCSKKVKGDCLNAIGKQFHPECFNCTYCGKLFGNSPFFLEDSLPYCENDWNELFTTKCIACGFPIEAGDRWVEALNNNYHSPCFNCSKCKVNLEGQSFYAKGGRPYCKSHAR